jgi:sortase A
VYGRRGGILDWMRRAVAGFGRTLVTLGLLILLFVAYQLWGTGYFTARAQASLEDDFAQAQQDYEAQLGDDPVVTPDTAAPTTPTTPAPLPIPDDGKVVGGINIDKIGVSEWFVQGTSRDNLQDGPGHYPETVMPGQLGNAAIAGHRTTYGAPFRRVDQLARGDRIELRMPYGRFVYRVERTRIVPPTEVSVTDPVAYDRLVLSACHPLYSAAQRIIVFARLERP